MKTKKELLDFLEERKGYYKVGIDALIKATGTTLKRETIMRLRKSPEYLERKRKAYPND